MTNKIYELDDADIVMILAEFNAKELEIIERFNNKIGEAIKEDKARKKRGNENVK